MRTRFLVIDGPDLIPVYEDQILYITVNENYCTIKLISGHKYASEHSLKDFQMMLSPVDFCRIHRNWIVAIDRIERITTDGVLVKERKLQDGKLEGCALPVSIDGKKDLIAKFYHKKQVKKQEKEKEN